MVNRVQTHLLSLHSKTFYMHPNKINKVYNLIILDESGSMEAIKQATIQGFNELLQSIKHSLKENPEIGQFVNYYSFNGSAIKELLPLNDASLLNFLTDKDYHPDNMTPLYDAVGLAVNRLKTSIQHQTNYSVLVTILTDGEENASTEYTHKAIASLINDMRSKGWVFTYIGANHDVEQTAFSLNINNHLHFNANEKDMKAMFTTTSNSRRSYIDKIKSGRTDLDKDFFKE
jgi:uncharacterized protein YegL